MNEEHINDGIIGPFRVVCIDTDDKPLQVDDDQWLKIKHEYIVTGAFKDLISGELSYTLLDMTPEPYEGYKSDRFTLTTSFSVN